MGKVIWTTHLKERIRQRGLNPNWVDDAVRFPDEVRSSTTTQSHQHIKVIHGYKVVAAVKRQGRDWIITSAWWSPAHRSSMATKDHRFFLEKWIDSGLRALEKLFPPRP